MLTIFLGVKVEAPHPGPPSPGLDGPVRKRAAGRAGGGRPGLLEAEGSGRAQEQGQWAELQPCSVTMGKNPPCVHGALRGSQGTRLHAARAGKEGRGRRKETGNPEETDMGVRSDRVSHREAGGPGRSHRPSRTR